MLLPLRYKSYRLSCKKCNLSEDMIFTKRIGQLGFRYWDTGNGKPVIKPRHGIINDRPPAKCPLCESRLTQEPGPVIQF